MRYLIAVAALVWAASSGAATLQGEDCDNGRRHVAGFCAAVLSSATGTADGATAGNCGASSDESDGTRYACVTTSATPLTCDQIQSCSGGTAVAGASASETGSNTLAVSGLTADQTVYCQTCNESPELWLSNVVVSSSFTPSAPASGENATRLDPFFSDKTAPFTINYPADPTTTSTISGSAVDSCSEIQSAVQTDGAEVTISPGTYSCTVRVDADDVDVIATGVTINGTLYVGGTSFPKPARMRWTGGTVNGTFELEKGDDILVDGLTANITNGRATPSNWTGGPGNGSDYNRERFAVINFSLLQSGAPSSGGWTVYSFAPNSGARSDGIGHADWIMANVIINSNGAQNWRVGDFVRGSFIDVYWNSDNLATNGTRWEGDIIDMWIEDSIGVGSTILPGAGNNITRATIRNWTRYHTLANVYDNMFNPSGRSIIDCTVNDSPFWDGGSGPFGGEVGLGAATGSNNIIFDWDGSTLPDDSSYGAP